MTEAADTTGAEEFLQYHVDSIVNHFSGLGDVALDRHEHTEPGRGTLFDRRKLDRLFRWGRLARKIVERLPNDSLRRGFSVISPDDPKIFDEDLDRLKATNQLRKAHIEALKTGGAGLFVMTDDLAPLDQPIDLDSLRSVQALHVFNRWELQPVEYASGLEEVEYDEPTLYDLNPNSHNAPTFKRRGKEETATQIHASRIIRFIGLEVDRENRDDYDGWGQPLLEGIWRSHRDVETASSSIATVLHEWKYDVFSVEGLLGLMAGPSGDPGTQMGSKFRQLLEAIIISKSLIKAIVIDRSLASYETRTVDFKGPVEAMGVMQQNLSADTEQPLTLLFGQAPKGFTSEDKTGRDNWGDKTRSTQKEVYAPAITSIVDLISRSSEGPTEGKKVEFTVVFPPLKEPDLGELADARKTTAEGDEIYAGLGGLGTEDIRKRHEGGEFAFNLQVKAASDDDPEEFDAMEEMRDALRTDSGPRIILALMPPPAFAQRAADLSPNDASEMHMTLVFLGRLDPLQRDAQITKIRQAVAWRVGLPGARAIDMKVSGGGTFANGKDLVRLLLVGGQGLAELRAALFWELQERGLMTEQTHGFIPHMTLEYHGKDNPPASGWESDLHEAGAWPEWIADEVAIVVEGEVVDRIKIGVRVDSLHGDEFVVQPREAGDVAIPDPTDGEGQKQDQEAIGYTSEAPSPEDERCAGCGWFEEPNGCGIVNGVIQPGGWCPLYDTKKFATGARTDVFTGPGDRTLPDSVKELSEQMRSVWVRVWNGVFGNTKDEGRAFAAANAVIARTK